MPLLLLQFELQQQQTFDPCCVRVVRGQGSSTGVRGRVRLLNRRRPFCGVRIPRKQVTRVQLKQPVQTMKILIIGSVIVGELDVRRGQRSSLWGPAAV
jgi:hypothetical protein